MDRRRGIRHHGPVVVSLLRTRFVIAGVALGLVWSAAGARAASDRGQYPAACADGGVLVASVSQRLGRDATVAAAEAGVRFTIDDSGPADAPAVEVTFTDGAGGPIGRRVFAFRDSSCQAALEAAAISVALFLEERGSKTANSAAPAPEPVVASPPPPASAPMKPAPRADLTVSPPAAVAPPPARSLGVQAGAIAGGGDMPWGVWAVEATVRGHRAGWPELFAGGAFWPQQQFLGNGVRTSWTRANGRAGLCPLQVRWESRRLAGCAALSLGRLTVESADLSPSYRQTRWISGADAAIALIQRIHGGWSVGLEARLVVPFQRSRVDVADPGGTTHDLFRAALVGAAGLLSVGYSFLSADR